MRTTRPDQLAAAEAFRTCMLAKCEELLHAADRRNGDMPRGISENTLSICERLVLDQWRVYAYLESQPASWWIQHLDREAEELLRFEVCETRDCRQVISPEFASLMQTATRRRVCGVCFLTLYPIAPPPAPSTVIDLREVLISAGGAP